MIPLKPFVAATALTLAGGSMITARPLPAVYENTQDSAFLPDTISKDTVSTDTVFDDNLTELVVTAQKKVIQSDGAKLTYNMSEDATSKGQSLLEALKKVPMITVDGEDNIRVNGDSNFKIYVNGKEEPMLEANASTIFKSMPAESFSKIEVITEPGAKFDAEGTGGIINLISEQVQKKDGYSGSVSASISNRTYAGSLLGRMKYGRLSADASITYASNSFLEAQKNISIREQTSLKSDLDYFQRTTADQRAKYHYSNAMLNMAYDLSEKDLITFGGSFMDMGAHTPKYQQTTSMFDKQGNKRWEFEQNIFAKIKNISASGNLSFQHNFDNNGHRMIVAYLFNYGQNLLDALSHNEALLNYHFPTPYTSDVNDNRTREHTAQIDYANPFGGRKHLLETGGKMILRHNTSYSTYGYGTNENNVAVSPEQDLDMLQRQNIYALYGSYTFNTDHLSAKGGVRYEHTDMGIDYRKGGLQDFDSKLNDVVPNAALTWIFGPATNLRLAYQMRISRPSLSQVNPYQISIMETMVMMGNPDLHSQRNNKITLTYTNFGRVFGGNIGLEYSTTDNSIVEFNYEDKGILYQTYANIGRNRVLAANGFFNWNITSSMTLSGNARISQLSLKSSSPYFSNSGWQGNWSANWTYTAPADVKFSAYAGQQFNRIFLQGKANGYYYYGVGVSRDFLKEKTLNVALNATNFLNKYNTYKSDSNNGSSLIHNEFRNYNWSVGINLSWRFGHLKSQTRKTDLRISNDDVEQSSSNDKGGGGIGI